MSGLTGTKPPDAVPYVERTRSLYSRQAPYRWVVLDRASDPPPWTPFEVPLARARVALIASGGVHRADQPPFHFHEDTSWREIPTDTPAAELP